MKRLNPALSILLMILVGLICAAGVVQTKEEFGKTLFLDTWEFSDGNEIAGISTSVTTDSDKLVTAEGINNAIASISGAGGDVKTDTTREDTIPYWIGTQKTLSGTGYDFLLEVPVSGDAADTALVSGEGIREALDAKAPNAPAYIVQTPADGLASEQAMSTLGDGIVKNTTGTGVLSIAVPGTDYQAPITENDDLDTSRVVVSNESGKLTTSAITTAELNQLDGVTDKIQSQIDGISTSLAADHGINTDASTLTVSDDGKPVTAQYSQDTGDANTMLLLHFDGVDASTYVTDYSPTGHTVAAAGDAQLDTAQEKFGLSSTLLDGTGDYWFAADSAEWDFGTGNFTIEAWIRFSSVAGTQTIACQESTDSSDKGWRFYYDYTDGLGFSYATATGDWTDDINFAWSPSTGIWYSVAVVRYGSVIDLYVNGTSIGSYNCAGDDLVDAEQQLWIGSSPDGGDAVNGWIDELRISDSARQTADYTVAASEFAVTKKYDISSTTSFTSISTDEITEKTAGHGVTVEDVSIKGGVIASDLNPATSGTDNNCLGDGAGASLTTGSDNVILGTGAGAAITTYSDNVIIGSGAAALAAGISSTVCIGVASNNLAPAGVAYSVLVGNETGQSLSNEYWNVIVGHQSAGSSTDGSYNSFFGGESGRNSDGDGNAFFGYGAGYDLDGDENVCIGYASAYAHGGGDGNVIIGRRAGYNGTGSYKLIIASNSTETDSTLIEGDFANEWVRINGSFEVGDGTDTTTIDGATISSPGDVTIASTGAGVNITTDAGDDFAVNTSALVVEGDTNNVGIGTASPEEPLHILSSVSGTYNNLVKLENSNAGNNTGAAIQLGGYYPSARVVGATPNAGGFAGGELKLQTYTDAQEWSTALTISKTQSVGIGTASPAHALDVAGSTIRLYDSSANSAPRWRLQNDAQIWDFIADGADGDKFKIKAGETVVAEVNTSGVWSVGNTFAIAGNTIINRTSTDPLATDGSGVIIAGSSDRRLKTNIADYRGGIDEIMSLRPVKYRWRDDCDMSDGGADHIGFIAQEVELIIPDAVGERDQLGLHDCKTFNPKKLIPALVNAVKQQQSSISSLKFHVAILYVISLASYILVVFAKLARKS